MRDDAAARLGGERCEYVAAEVQHLDAVAPLGPRRLEAFVHRAQRVDLVVVVTSDSSTATQVEVAPARMEVAGGQRAEQVQASEPAAEMCLDQRREIGEGRARILEPHSDGGRFGSGFGQELLAVEPRVQTAVGEQLVVAAALDYSAVLHDDDQVGAQDRRQPVGDGDRRAALLDALDRGLDEPLRDRVKCRCRLVQHEDARVLEHHPGERDPLLLAA